MIQIGKTGIVEKDYLLHTSKREFKEYEQIHSIQNGDYVINLKTGDKFTYNDLSMDNMLSTFAGYKKGWIFSANFKQRLINGELEKIEIPSSIFDIPVVGIEFKSFSKKNIQTICSEIVISHFEKEVENLDIPIYCKKEIKSHNSYKTKLNKSIDEFVADVYKRISTIFKDMIIPNSVINMDGAFKETPIEILPNIPESVLSINNMCAMSDIRIVNKLPHKVKFAKRTFFDCQKLVAALLENNFKNAQKSDVLELFANCTNLIYFSDTGTMLNEEQFSQCISLVYRPKHFGENTTTIFPEKVPYDNVKVFLEDERTIGLDMSIGVAIAENAKEIVEKEKIFNNIDKYINDNISSLNSLSDFYG